MDLFNNNIGQSNDFQPQSSNLQAANGGLQIGNQAQSTSNWSILNNENAQISIPSPSAAVRQKIPDSATTNLDRQGGISWLPIIVATVLIVVAAEFILRRREKSKLPATSFANETNPPKKAKLDVTDPVSINNKPNTTSKKSRKKTKRKKKR